MNKGRKGKGVPSLGNIPSGLPVIVTGASGSIGREICRALARLGVPVIMACRSEARYAQTYGELLREFPAFDAVFLPLDLNMSSSVTEAVNRLKGVRLAGIINNAGTMERHFSLSADGPETTMNVNYHNTRLLNQLLLPQIAPGGSVVFTTSLTRRRLGTRHLPATVTEESFGQLRSYSLSKAWITRFAAGFASEGKKCGVRVNCADPGVVDSSMIRMDRWFDPIADIVFRPLIRTPRNGAVPALRALLSDETSRIYTLRASLPLNK